MDDGRQPDWTQALRESRQYLMRWEDRFTVSMRDDFAQESAVALLEWLDPSRPIRSLSALVRTISRRTRARALRRHLRASDAVAESGAEPWLTTNGERTPRIDVLGHMVPRSWLLDRLTHVLPRLDVVNRSILLGYYEGFSCSELAERLGLDPLTVKVRLYRARGCLRRKLEREVRAADQFES